jgi:two-component system response regulator RegA
VRRIILVDDDASFARQVRADLIKRDIELTWTQNGSRALDCVRSGRFNQLIVDPGLPGCLWYGFLSELMGACPGIDALVVTAFASSALSRLAREVGVRSFIVKPIDSASLLDALMRDHSHWSALERTESLASIEWEHLNDVIYSSQGNVTAAAHRLGIPRQTLYRKVRKHSPVSSSPVVRAASVAATRYP